MTIATDFSGADWVGQLSVGGITATSNTEIENDPTAGSCIIRNFNGVGTDTDPDHWFLTGHGDQ